MTHVWRLFNAVISSRNNPNKAYQESVQRIHRMKNDTHHESVGYVEQRYLHAPKNVEPQVHFYVECLAGERHEPIRVNTLEDGMNLLLLLIRERGSHV